jgi:hypothetical protein
LGTGQSYGEAPVGLSIEGGRPAIDAGRARRPRVCEHPAVGSAVMRDGSLAPAGQSWRKLGVAGWSPARLAGRVFAVALVGYAVSPNVTNYDSYLAFPTAVSILHSGDLTLDEFDAPAVSGHYGAIERDGRTYDFYPWPVALVFVPVAAVVDVAGLAGVGDGSTALVESDAMGAVSLAAASAVTAAAAALVAFMAARRSQAQARHRNAVGLAVGLVFAFGTASWSTASRSLWQHGPSMALLAGALAVAVGIVRRANLREADTPAAGVDRAFVALGALAGAAYAVRPTNAVVVAAFGIWCGLHGLRPLVAYAAGGGLVAVPWMLVNHSTFGDVLPPYHAGGRVAFHADYGEALAANLLSPSRGLFVFAPVAIVALAGVVVAWRSRTIDSLHVLSLAVFVGYLLVVSAGREAWWAGHSIGPRFLTDPLPMLALLAVPVADRIAAARREATEPAAPRWTIAVAVVAVAVAASVAVNGGAAVMRSTNCWNTVPTDVNDDPDRVWSLERPQFLAGYLTVLDDGPRAAVLGTCGADSPATAGPSTAH